MSLWVMSISALCTIYKGVRRIIQVPASDNAY